MTDPLVPPPEHAHLRWHFIIVPYREDPEPKEWIDNAWQHNRMHATPFATARAGWRYHGPCDPSAITLNPEDEAALIRVGCVAASPHHTCSFPECTCAAIPAAVRAVFRALKEMKR